MSYRPILGLIFASAVAFGLITLRVIWTAQLHHLYLVWNLFLAWMPLFFAIAAKAFYERRSTEKWRFALVCIGWLLFLPNASYIFTDLSHLRAWHRGHVWIDLVLILLFAWTGFVAGFISLRLMQDLVTRSLGRISSWIFVATAAVLSGLGVYLGRFLRWNSWDLVFRPDQLLATALTRLDDPFGHRMLLVFPFLFGTFVFVGYVMLDTLTGWTPRPSITHSRDSS